MVCGSGHRTGLSEGAGDRAVRILSQEVYRGFGPTLASEYLARNT